MGIYKHFYDYKPDKKVSKKIKCTKCGGKMYYIGYLGNRVKCGCDNGYQYVVKVRI